MKSRFNDFFDFTKGEYRGILLFLLFLMGIILANIVISQIMVDKKVDFSAFSGEIARFEQNQKRLADSAAKARSRWSKNDRSEVSFFGVDKSIAKNELNPFPFNPNNLSVELWKRMGLMDKQIKSIKNFEAKGGKFRTKEDFKKMYAISADEYAILEPYITIPQDSVPQYVPKKIKFAEVKIDLNSADTFELQKVPGIGAAMARRIFNQRVRMGGFYSKEQLHEVYGMDSARFAKCTPYLNVDPAKVAKININTAEVKELVKHPYLDLYMSKSIVVYRKKVGRYKSTSEIKNAALIYDELYQKLLPYLTVE